MRRFILNLGIAAGLPIFLGACTDRAADLQTRLTAAQDELAQVKAELASSKSGGESTSPSGGPALPSTSEIEHNYDRAMNDFRTQLQNDLSDGKTLTVIPSNPRVEEKPYHGDFAVEVTLNSRPVRLENVPVQAGLDGQWTFPPTASVIDKLRHAPAPDSSTPTRPASRSTSASDSPAGTPASLMPANQTVTIAWPDSPGRSSATPQRAASDEPAPAPRSAAPSAPAPASDPNRLMPTNRDVRIKF